MATDNPTIYTASLRPALDAFTDAAHEMVATLDYEIENAGEETAVDELRQIRRTIASLGLRLDEADPDAGDNVAAAWSEPVHWSAA